MPSSIMSTQLAVCLCSSEPTVVIEKNTGEGIKIKAIELGLTVVLSERNKIFVKVSFHCIGLLTLQFNTVSRFQ